MVVRSCHQARADRAISLAQLANDQHVAWSYHVARCDRATSLAVLRVDLTWHGYASRHGAPVPNLSNFRATPSDLFRNFKLAFLALLSTS